MISRYEMNLASLAVAAAANESGFGSSIVGPAMCRTHETDSSGGLRPQTAVTFCLPMGYLMGQKKQKPRKALNLLYEVLIPFSGGGGEIRTHGRITPSPVFKTGALNRSATPPSPKL
jgi:hypothetical protein